MFKSVFGVMEKGPFREEKPLREIKCIFKNKARIPKVQIRQLILVTGNAAAVSSREQKALK